MKLKHRCAVSRKIRNMKTLKVSDAAHRELIRLLGQMMAQTKKQQTFSDVIEALVTRAVLLPHELLRQVDEFIEANKQMGYTTREEFVREAVTEALRRRRKTARLTSSG